MTVEGQDALGIYISVPFCRSKCTYCNFASGVFAAGDHARYVERVIEDLAGADTWAAEMGVELPRRVDTVYLGGGTPSLLEPELVTKLFAALHATFDVDADAELTMECAPGLLEDATLGAMAAAGVNRVSLGVQSLVDSEAHASGRLHDRAAVVRDVERLRAAGITNINVDLIAGLAGQTLATWEQSLDALLELETPHASVYMLEVDEDSRLGREMLKGGARYGAGLVANDDAIARMYERAIERLEAAGLMQYEISNFGRPGFESRHNLRYWERRPYLGVGLDASSMLRSDPTLNAKARLGWGTQSEGELAYVLRTTTTDDLKEYLAGSAKPETAWLNAERQHEEAWFLGLRTNAGVDVAKRLAGDGLLNFECGRVRLTARGRMVSNDVFQEFLGLEVVEAVRRK